MAVTIAFFIINTKLSIKYEHWGRTEEAKAGNREAEQLRNATQEKRDKYVKQKKEEDILVIVGMVLIIAIVFPTFAALWILIAMNAG